MIEINRGKSPYIYTLDPDDKRNILRRENKHRARWYWYARRDTPQEAKKMLLQLTKEASQCS